MPRGGAQQLSNALAAYLKALGGEIVTGARVASLDQLPSSAAISAPRLRPPAIVHPPDMAIVFNASARALPLFGIDATGGRGPWDVWLFRGAASAC